MGDGDGYQGEELYMCGRRNNMRNLWPCFQFCDKPKTALNKVKKILPVKLIYVYSIVIAKTLS